MSNEMAATSIKTLIDTAVSKGLFVSAQEVLTVTEAYNTLVSLIPQQTP